MRLVVDAPASLPVRHLTRLLPAVEPQRTQSDGRVRWAFEAGPLAAIESVEVLTPGDVAVWPLVGVSTGESWAQVAQRYGQIVDSQIAAAELAGIVKKASILHTLACLYADLGRATEAREVILQAMEAGGYDEPKSHDWYVFGRIAEHYGVAEAAAQAYGKVEAPEREEDLLTSTYAMAQRRLEALAAEPHSDAPTRAAVP